MKTIQHFNSTLIVVPTMVGPRLVIKRRETM